MKRTVLPIIVLAASLSQVANAQTSSSTPIIGYYKFDVPAGQSAWVCGFVTKKDFQSQATSVAPGANMPDGTPTTVITQNGAGWANNAFPLHYVEIISAGSTQGLVMDVVSNTATTVRVRGAVTGTPTYCIRKHATLKGIFQDVGALVAFTDSVTVYNSNNTLSTYLPTGTGGNWVADDFVTPANDAIIYPGQGFIIASSSNTVITTGGGEVSYVKTGPTKVPVYRKQTNFVGHISPLVATQPADPLYNVTATPTVAGGVVTLGTIGVTTSGLEEFVDTITLFTQGGGLNPSGTYLVGGGNVIADDFVTVSNNVPVRNGYSMVISAESADRLVTFPQNYPAN